LTSIGSGLTNNWLVGENLFTSACFVCFPVGFLEKLFTCISNIECIKVLPYFLRPKWFHALIIHLIQGEGFKQWLDMSEAKKRVLKRNFDE